MTHRQRIPGLFEFEQNTGVFYFLKKKKKKKKKKKIIRKSKWRPVSHNDDGKNL